MKVLVLAAFTICAILGSANVVSGKTFGKCELAKILVANGIAKSAVPDWICLVQYESSFSSTATNKNSNGSTDYGLFQINNKFWCDSNYGANDCNITCKSLINDDITDDIKCALLIHRRHGFNAWYGWLDHCKGKPLPSVAECF
uniref:Putative lysozyme n=1 Tax=Anopheles triannulatus TaxID=58253 RepID=A0A2M4A1S3_9DIPT